MPSPPCQVAATFRTALATFGPGPVWVVGHNDADGLTATALFARTLPNTRNRLIGRGESAWSDELRAEFATIDAGGLIVTDLGVQPRLPKPGTPTIIVDHHMFHDGTPDGATVITGTAYDPIPTSSLLAWWCVGSPPALLWLAAIGLIGDLAETHFPAEMVAARPYGITALREAAALVNAPRRTASADAGPALDALLQADGPKPIAADPALQAAREEVKAELAQGRRAAPRIKDGVALLRFSSPAQIHPLIAQQWRGRLKNEIVVAANTGYRPGWVHFAVRSAADRDLFAFLADHRPPGAGTEYGNGHRRATGGALRQPDWDQFIATLGFAA